MLQSIREFFTKHLALKVLSLVLALLVWFYIVNALNKGSSEELQILKKMRPNENMIARKLTIKPVLIGKPHFGYMVRHEQIMVTPEYCMVVGSKDVLNKIKFAYTIPIDTKRASKNFTVSVPLNSIASGVYVEDTPVQVTVPVEKETDRQI